MYKKIIILYLFLLPTLSLADFKDPTKPDYMPPPSSDSDSVTLPAAPELVLYAVWTTARMRWANINGIIAKQGQTILDGVKINNITRNTVSLTQHGTPKTLRLTTQTLKTK